MYHIGMTITVWRKILTGENIDEFSTICQYFPYQPYSTGNASGVLYCEYSTVRCEKRIISKKSKWHIQVNLAEINLLTETFA